VRSRTREAVASGRSAPLDRLPYELSSAGVFPTSTQKTFPAPELNVAPPYAAKLQACPVYSYVATEARNP